MITEENRPEKDVKLKEDDLDLLTEKERKILEDTTRKLRIYMFLTEEMKDKGPVYEELVYISSLCTRVIQLRKMLLPDYSESGNVDLLEDRIKDRVKNLEIRQ